MRNALNVVNMLLETQNMRVCSACEKEFGTVPVQPGVQKSHGLCKRHAYIYYADAGMGREAVDRQDASAFAPDLSESVNNYEARRFAHDTGLTLHPEIQYGAIDARSVEQLPPEQKAELTKMANWEFTDRRPDGGVTQGFTFYAPVNATYDQMMALWRQKQAGIAA